MLQCFRRVHVNLLPVLIPMYMPSVIRNIGKRIREFIVDVHSDGGGGGVMCVASDISVIVCHSIHFLFFPILSLSLSLSSSSCLLFLPTESNYRNAYPGWQSLKRRRKLVIQRRLLHQMQALHRLNKHNIFSLLWTKSYDDLRLRL